MVGLEFNPSAPMVDLPTVYLCPTGMHSRPYDAVWIGRIQVHSDDDGETHIIIPCRCMEVTICYGDDDSDIAELEDLIKQLQTRIEEIKEQRA